MVMRDVVSWMLTNTEAASLVLRVSLLSLGAADCSSRSPAPSGEGPQRHSTTREDSEGLLTRAVAVRVGRAALQAGMLEHVLGEQAFDDKSMFCRAGPRLIS